MTALTITAHQFAELVRPVLPLAGGKNDLPSLGSVHLEVRGGFLLAMATDRYRMGVKRMPTKVKAFTATVATRDIKTILAAFKPVRGVDPDLRLTVTDGRLTVECDAEMSFDLFAAASISFATLDPDYPNLLSLLDGVKTAEVGCAPDGGVDLRRLAGFQAAGTRCSLRITVDAKAPILVTTEDPDFIGLLMPTQRDAPAAPWESWEPLRRPGRIVATKGAAA